LENQINNNIFAKSNPMALYNDKEILREIEHTENDFEIQKQKTSFVKIDFINQMKMGLGDEIKNTPKIPKIRKKTTIEKVKIFIRNIFLRF
jgi:hypothetical protein